MDRCSELKKTTGTKSGATSAGVARLQPSTAAEAPSWAPAAAPCLAGLNRRNPDAVDVCCNSERGVYCRSSGTTCTSSISVSTTFTMVLNA